MLAEQKAFDAILQECFDLNDLETLRTLTSLDEAGQNQILVNLADQLYEKIVDKVDDIDYGTIPKSGGDITKIENYNSMIECLEIIREIVKQYGQNEEPVDTVLTAIYNIRDRKPLFEKSFGINNELGQIVYNNLTMACVAATSFMIAISIEFIKSPTDDTFEISLDKVAYRKTLNNMLFNDLRKFNISCKKGEFDKAMKNINEIMTQKLTGAGVGAAIGAGALITLIFWKNILGFIQDIVYLFFYTSQTISDYWATQADLLQMNRSTIIYRRDIPETKKSDIIRKQSKIADNMRKVANVFAVNTGKAEKDTRNALQSETRKYRARKTTFDDNPTPAGVSIF